MTMFDDHRRFWTILDGTVTAIFQKWTNQSKVLPYNLKIYWSKYKLNNFLTLNNFSETHGTLLKFPRWDSLLNSSPLIINFRVGIGGICFKLRWVFNKIFKLELIRKASFTEKKIFSPVKTVKISHKILHGSTRTNCVCKWAIFLFAKNYGLLLVNPLSHDMNHSIWCT